MLWVFLLAFVAIGIAFVWIALDEPESCWKKALEFLFEILS